MRVCLCLRRTCEQRVIVQAPLFVLMRAHVKQVRLDGAVDEVCGEIEEHHAEHHHHDGPYAPQRSVPHQRCKKKKKITGCQREM